MAISCSYLLPVAYPAVGSVGVCLSTKLFAWVVCLIVHLRMMYRTRSTILISYRPTYFTLASHLQEDLHRHQGEEGEVAGQRGGLQGELPVGYHFYLPCVRAGFRASLPPRSVAI